MYQQYPVSGYAPEAQQMQAAWPGAGGYGDGGCMDPSYNSYPAAGGHANGFGGGANGYNPSAQAPQMPQQGISAQIQQNSQFQQGNGYSNGHNAGPSSMNGNGHMNGNGKGGGMNGSYGGNNGSFGGGGGGKANPAFGGGGGKGGAFGGGGGFGGGNSNAFGGYGGGGNYGGGGMGGMGGMGGDYDDEFYPRYNQGSGAEYAQNQLSTQAVQDSDEGLEVTIYGETGENIPEAVDSWDKCAEIFPAPLVQECRNAGFAKPMPIQANTWGVGVLGRDLIGVAKTGSGKTLAYLFLGFMKLMQNRTQGPGMLCLAPTRELAQQIEQESVKFGNPLRLKTACCYGGASRGPQLGAIRRGAQVIVATPGRLNDFLQAGQVRLAQCGFLVLDEADRMLDLGFEPQIRTIIQCLPAERQTLLYTATWPKELRSLASDFLTKPIHVHVGSGDKLAANKDINQIVMIVQNEQQKMEELREILKTFTQGNRVLIFCETKAATAYLAQQLKQQERINSVAIHGDLAQRDRDWALESFKSGRAPIMVATDVAGRGLDIKGIAAVVNWDAAHNAEDYVHRIGRTARAGEKGIAYTFLCPDESRKARDIVNVMENTGLTVSPDLLQLAGRCRGGKGKGKKGKGKGRGFGGKGKGGGGARGPPGGKANPAFAGGGKGGAGGFGGPGGAGGFGGGGFGGGGKGGGGGGATMSM